ncbi:MAG TPA: precorrin-8X methylmutase, partial [Dehalococcoidia bacterium]|nr:precorrin-8X methylmutase [Dehalococcoidia bacterium]
MNVPGSGPLLRSLGLPPEAIERLSVERLQADAGILPWRGDELRLALRLGYAVGDADILKQLVISPGAIEAGRTALSSGRPVVSDVRMVASGIDRPPA